MWKRWKAPHRARSYARDRRDLPPPDLVPRSWGTIPVGGMAGRGVRDGGPMRLPSPRVRDLSAAGLVVALLLGACGCVSVRPTGAGQSVPSAPSAPTAPARPAPPIPPAPDLAEPATWWPTPAEPEPYATLEATDPVPGERPRHPAGAGVSPVREVREGREGRKVRRPHGPHSPHGPRAAKPRKAAPGGHVVRRPVRRPRAAYDPGAVCRMADGVVDPATVAACRAQHGW
jgi:translation initiation factor IF-2